MNPDTTTKHFSALALVACLSFGPAAFAQSDPGPRHGAAGAGGAFAALGSTEKSFFDSALSRFQIVSSVSGTLSDGKGLGPAFNGNSCAQCHAQPATGGSSPGLSSPQNPVRNPQITLANQAGATNTIPSFITATGPVREARFIHSTSNSSVPDGGVHDLYTIQGRSDAKGCVLAQPDFATQVAGGNVVFRIPTPVFGLGLVESTTEATLRANLAANAAQKQALGISGRFNVNGNDGTITRFGWKAQEKSLLSFAGEAYNVEQGVTNELFPNERKVASGCTPNPTPEDDTDVTGRTGTSDASASNITEFAVFMRLSAPPTPATTTASQVNGSNLFASIGCAACHSSSLTSGPSRFTGMSNVVYHPFSDFALHNMGATLSDGILQGVAGADEFRTAPLWGLGQRLFFMHDGRTSDLLHAIELHSSSTQCSPFGGTPCGSEANTVINNFNKLSSSQKQDILNFLRSL